MQLYTPSLTEYKRLATKEVKIGDLLLGNFNPIRVQTMTTTDTMNTIGTVEQSIRCIEAGAELVRITAPSKKEAENLLNIKNELRKRGYKTPLVADIHFTPNAAEIAARIVEKVRVNPGNYVDKKKFELIEYSDADYLEEIERIRERFTPLVKICKEYGTAMRIGTNHGSLSDRIMSRYGDTAIGMVDIGTLLEDGIGDTIRVSLTEDPEFEIPVCKDLVKRYSFNTNSNQKVPAVEKISYDPFTYKRRETFAVDNIGDKHVPVVVADLSRIQNITPADLKNVGYTYDEATDKWTIGDAAADYIFTGHQLLNFALPGTLKVIVYPNAWLSAVDKTKYFPIFSDKGFTEAEITSKELNFVMIDCYNDETPVNDYTYLESVANDSSVVLCLSSANKNALQSVRRMMIELMNRNIKNPVVLICDSNGQTSDEHLIHYAIETGGLLLDGLGDGVCLGMGSKSYEAAASSESPLNASGRNYLSNQTVEQFINNTAFSILQATRTRISKTEYISCPSCGRTLFDLQETTAKIRSVTNHLKGVKIAIMGCIVNGPGEMADADFGYVGSGPGKITLYKGKEVVKRNVDSEVAVDELINLLKESEAWVAPA
ncbi:MAG: flavodoxin-dependent (E)-4-hydroxy-3-methylbut-2-enyl-diphosphate synthase [Sphingobacteriales bacterium]|nr:flavodoxin-dependent (E)-4-hydroxy-3-methylbut-2-enyl-diphosphate synthase [Sphingobacteriales bacterium]